VGVMILQGAVNVFGSSVVASYTAASKVENLATQTMPALGTTMATYCGQNLGARKYERIFDGMRKGFLLVLVISLLGTVITAGFGKYIVCLFLKNPSDTVLEYAVAYLNTVSFFFIPLAMIFLYRSSLQGLDQTFVPVMSGVLELVCRVFVIALFLEPFGYQAVCYTNPAAWAATGILLLFTYLFWKQKARRLL